MKIYDCTMFHDDNLMYDVRFNILDKYVDKFVIVEANFYHSGNAKEFKFRIQKFKKFKNKIIYIKLNKLPSFSKNEMNNKRLYLSKITNYQRNSLLEGIHDASEEDIILYSDSDEIPNFSNLSKSKLKNIFFFKQKIFYYKFNLLLPNNVWYGTKGCKKKKLINFEWLSHIKPKNYPWWRIDTFADKLKINNLQIIENGGWHFTHLKSPKNLLLKFKNDEHSDEFRFRKVNLEKIKDMIKKQYIPYGLNVDKKNIQDRYNSFTPLVKINLKYLPLYIKNNHKKFSNWLT